MAEVARAHSQGRRLYIGTTHLDADALVVWNMGAIASSGHPEALTLFRKIILASSSVPGLFPPVLIDVQVDGLSYDEMHVDGGIKTQLFVTEQFASLTGERAHVSIFVIRNGVTSPSPEPVPRRVAAISQRAMQSMIRSQVQHDLNEVYDFAQENGFEFNWVAPPREFTIEDVGFNTLEMNRLYDAGFEMGQQAEPGWLKEP
jgi:predicted acylesterase/phospholipase RssA